MKCYVKEGESRAIPFKNGLSVRFGSDDSGTPLRCNRSGGRKISPSVFRLSFDGDDRRSDAIARYALGHIFSADIELVGWGKFIQRGVPLGPRIGLVREREIASRARNR